MFLDFEVSLEFGLTQKRFSLANLGQIRRTVASLKRRRMSCIGLAGFGTEVAKSETLTHSAGYARPVDCRCSG
jgi:hypothetical protein